jgi:Zn-dependent protease with chaperone function
MLLPFLPYLFALSGATLVLALGEPAAEATVLAPAELGLAALGLLALGLLLGHLPESMLGSRLPTRVSLRRVLLLGVWLGLLAAPPLHGGLFALARGRTGGDEALLLAVLALYWVADTCTLQPLGPGGEGGAAAQGRRLLRHLGVPLPLLALYGGGVALSALAEPFGAAAAGWLPGWLRMALQMTGAMAAMALLTPHLIRWCWVLPTLRPPESERLVAQELAANGVRATRVLEWPEPLMGSITAGVVGLLPGFRFLLVAPTLARALTPEELRSVTAHEAAHVRHRHLWYYLAAMLAFAILFQLASQLLVLAGLVVRAVPPLWLMVTLELLALLAFLRFGLGFLSREFERQADGHALRRTGLAPFQSAMAKVALLNRIPIEVDNWHHYGVGRRIEFARRASVEPETLDSHDRRVARIKALGLATLGAIVVAQVALSGTDAANRLVERVWEPRIAGIAEPTPTELRLLEALAMYAYEQRDLVRAERYFRRLIAWRPADPRGQNNLAWLLATREPTDPQALAESLRLAMSAAQTSESAYIWDTLAEAYARGGHAEKARAAAAHALELAEAGLGRGEASLAYYRDRLRTLGGGAVQ